MTSVVVMGFVFAMLLFVGGMILLLQLYKHHRKSSDDANIAMCIIGALLLFSSVLTATSTIDYAKDIEKPTVEQTQSEFDGP